MIRRARRADLIDAAPVVAVDATGLETRHVSVHFGHKRAKGKAGKGKGTGTATGNAPGPS